MTTPGVRVPEVRVPGVRVPRTVVVKYNAGNVASVLYALERLGVAAAVTDDQAAIRAADRVIFPGVGEASSAMAWLRARGLDQVLRELRQPVLGICLGMQLMCASSEEGAGAEDAAGPQQGGADTGTNTGTDTGTGTNTGTDTNTNTNTNTGTDTGTGTDTDTECLGIFPQTVRRFPAGAGLKIPQVGWNEIRNLRGPLFKGMAGGEFVYFVHGYHVGPGEHTVAVADYGGEYSAALRRDNFHAVQFHPERSGAVGHRILQNFIYGAH